MKLKVCNNVEELGRVSADLAENLIKSAIKENGKARILLSTGASQFPFFLEIVKRDIEWEKVEMFHLDEYVGIPKTHPASFNNYLYNRFVSKVNLGAYHLIDGEIDPKETIKNLTELIEKSPIDVGLIGIGENAHIAFNDPPAVFNDTCAYKVVTLAKRCLRQQIGEGWFKSEEECYKQAISMTCSQIMKCRHIISVVPYKVKAQAIHDTFIYDNDPMYPATLLKQHPDCTVVVDRDSASLLSAELIWQLTSRL